MGWDSSSWTFAQFVLAFSPSASFELLVYQGGGLCGLLEGATGWVRVCNRGLHEACKCCAWIVFILGMGRLEFWIIFGGVCGLSHLMLDETVGE